MAAIEQFKQVFLTVPIVSLHCPPRCDLTEFMLEGHFRNAFAVWKT